MNKSDLVQRIAMEHGLGPGQARLLVDAVLGALMRAVEEGEPVSLGGFGTFELRQHREKLGRNPNTGERLLLPPRPAIVFRPSRAWRKSVSQAQDGGSV